MHLHGAAGEVAYPLAKRVAVRIDRIGILGHPLAQIPKANGIALHVVVAVSLLGHEVPLGFDLTKEVRVRRRGGRDVVFIGYCEGAPERIGLLPSSFTDIDYVDCNFSLHAIPHHSELSLSGKLHLFKRAR